MDLLLNVEMVNRVDVLGVVTRRHIFRYILVIKTHKLIQNSVFGERFKVLRNFIFTHTPPHLADCTPATHAPTNTSVRDRNVISIPSESFSNIEFLIS